jgi:hypothetical protein
MRVLVTTCDSLLDLDLTSGQGNIRHWFVHGLREHDLRDLEFALAQRRAMSKRCSTEDGEHTCGNAPDDGHLRHLCRACTYEWPREQEQAP